MTALEPAVHRWMLRVDGTDRKAATQIADRLATAPDGGDNSTFDSLDNPIDSGASDGGAINDARAANKHRHFDLPQ